MMVVPNYSEGRDKKIIEGILDNFRNIEGVELKGYQSDEDHNRTVVELVGERGPLINALLNSVKFALENINMKNHRGAHPRMGAVDVIPFIPLISDGEEECIEAAEELGSKIGDLGIGVYMYEKNARTSDRKNLADIRRGEYEGFSQKLKDDNWIPDYGPREFNEKFGVVAVGSRFHLIAFNVNLNSNNLEIAKDIAKKIRHSGGGLKAVKAIGLKLEDRDLVQVSINMVDYRESSIYQALEMIKFEAKRYGVTVGETEIIGFIPLEAMVDVFKYYTRNHTLDLEQVLF